MKRVYIIADRYGNLIDKNCEKASLDIVTTRGSLKNLNYRSRASFFFIIRCLLCFLE